MQSVTKDAKIRSYVASWGTEEVSRKQLYFLWVLSENKKRWLL